MLTSSQNPSSAYETKSPNQVRKQQGKGENYFENYFRHEAQRTVVMRGYAMTNAILHTRQHEPLGSSESWQNCWYTVTEVGFLPAQQSSTIHGTSYWPEISHLQLMQELQRDSNLLKSNNWSHLAPQVKI